MLKLTLEIEKKKLRLNKMNDSFLEEDRLFIFS